MAIFKKDKEPELLPMPQHVAIIMDGNGRWATSTDTCPGRRAMRREPRPSAKSHSTAGTESGVKDPATVYAFSTENWKRPQEEVGKIMSLMKDYLLESIRDMQKNHVRIRFFFGDLGALSPELQQLAAEASQESMEFHDSQVNMCINYGSRDEILRAARRWAKDCAEHGTDPDSLDAEQFSKLLYSENVPDPDLIIRPGGETGYLQFPALAGGLFRALFYRCDVAGL